MLLLLTIALVTYIIYVYARYYTLFSRYGIKHYTPIPLLGNMLRMTFQQEHFKDSIVRYYNGFPNERFVGKYEFTKPMVIIRDVDLVKKIAVKDFDYFVDHRSFVDEVTDPLFGRNLFSLKGQRWKDMRSTLSPAFTSSKIKLMLPLMVEVGEQMNKALKKNIEESGVGYIDADIKDLTSRFANDVVATCAFGLKVDSYSQKDNQFYILGKEAALPNFRQLVIFFGYSSFPALMRALNLSLFTEASKSFFKTLVMSTMQEREEKNIIRPDMIHMLMEAKKGKLVHDEKQVDSDAGFATVEESSIGKKNVNKAWSDDDLIAQAILFFLAGFETVSAIMCFVLHELALNPDVQQRLVEEIRENEAKSKDKCDYNAIQSMNYLDMVISAHKEIKMVTEVMRLWPAVAALDRVCTRDYNCGKPNDQATEDFIIPAGTGLNIPVWAFHHDPELFPDPEKFDPERFSEKNKHNIKPFTYMPFGLGPRNCIGSRFALCELKIMVYQILREIELSICEKTDLSGEMSTHSFQPLLKGGHWLRMRIRA